MVVVVVVVVVVRVDQQRRHRRRLGQRRRRAHVQEAAPHEPVREPTDRREELRRWSLLSSC